MCMKINCILHGAVACDGRLCADLLMRNVDERFVYNVCCEPVEFGIPLSKKLNLASIIYREI